MCVEGATFNQSSAAPAARLFFSLKTHFFVQCVHLNVISVQVEQKK